LLYKYYSFLSMTAELHWQVAGTLHLRRRSISL
jgi:hypothetical protein